MIHGVWDAASWLTFQEVAEVDLILYAKALDSWSRWKVRHVWLRIGPKSLIPCWDLHDRCYGIVECSLFNILWGFLCSKLGCQILYADLLKLCKYYLWMTTIIRKKLIFWSFPGGLTVAFLSSCVLREGENWKASWNLSILKEPFTDEILLINLLKILIMFSKPF